METIFPDGAKGATPPAGGALEPLPGSRYLHPKGAAELRTFGRALRQGWHVTNDERAKGKRAVLAVLDDPRATLYHLLTAVKVLALLDSIDARRERTATVERGHDVEAQLEAMRAAMRSPQGQEAIALLTKQLSTGTPGRHASPTAEPPANGVS
jgi:hypothetical protein